jgi:hypothetical protein
VGQEGGKKEKLEVNLASDKTHKTHMARTLVAMLAEGKKIT